MISIRIVVSYKICEGRKIFTSSENIVKFAENILGTGTSLSQSKEFTKSHESLWSSQEVMVIMGTRGSYKVNRICEARMISSIS